MPDSARKYKDTFAPFLGRACQDYTVLGRPNYKTSAVMKFMLQKLKRIGVSIAHVNDALLLRKAVVPFTHNRLSRDRR